LAANTSIKPVKNGEIVMILSEILMSEFCGSFTCNGNRSLFSYEWQRTYNYREIQRQLSQHPSPGIERQ
jgi:hypothetical protein